MTGDPEPNPSTANADVRRPALKVIAALVHDKKTAPDQVLRRTGVPEDLNRGSLTDRNPATGERRSKRVAGATILE
jgi:hypothetical protein